MNELMTFTNKEFGQLRTIEINDEAYFVGKDVAEALGYARPDHAITKHVDSEDKLMYQIGTSGQNRQMFIINESGVYSLILGSKLPRAKAYKHWVTSEILPSISRTGMYIKQPEKMTDVQLVTITPKMAEEILKKNIGNRKFNQAAVNRIAEDMRMGNYAVNGTSIKFYKDGTLADGQHRCAACVKAGVPFVTYVINGLDREVLPTIDCGRPRSLVDTLNMAGCTIQKKLVPAMNVYFAKGMKLTAGQAQALWNAYEDKFTMLCDVLAGGHHDYIVSQSSLRSYLIHLAISENWSEDDLRTFVNGIKDKPNRENSFEMSCYNFRNFYNRNVHNKLCNAKSAGDRTKTNVVIDALSALTESYKSNKVVKSFAYRGRAKAILATGQSIAQRKFAELEAENQHRIEMQG